MPRTVDDSSFRLLAERALDLIYRYEISPALGFEYVSPSVERLLGYTPEELVEDPELVFRIVTPEHLAHMDRVGPDGWAEPQEVQVRRKDGSTVWIEERLTPIFDDDGALIAVEGIARDIDQRKQAESLLAEREQQLAEAQALAHVGSWEWDIASNEVRWTDEMFRIYGLEPGSSEVTYEVYLSHVHPDDRFIAARNVSSALETGIPFASDYRILRPDGEVRWLHSRGRLTSDDEGRPVKMTGICHDITDRRQAEDDRSRLEAVGLRHRQAMEIHDNIVQGLAVASMALHMGDHTKGLDAIDATLATAREIVSSLLAGDDDLFHPEPGDLRRATPALLD
jgi:PAS domain S-box-containing protein